MSHGLPKVCGLMSSLLFNDADQQSSRASQRDHTVSVQCVFVLSSLDFYLIPLVSESEGSEWGLTSHKRVELHPTKCFGQVSYHICAAAEALRGPFPQTGRQRGFSRTRTDSSTAANVKRELRGKKLGVVSLIPGSSPPSLPLWCLAGETQ